MDWTRVPMHPYEDEWEGADPPTDPGTLAGVARRLVTVSVAARERRIARQDRAARAELAGERFADWFLACVRGGADALVRK